MSWWDTSWQYRKKLTFDNSGQAENLVNFPVLVHLDASNFDFSKAKSAGADIRFVDSNDATTLKYEIEKWVDSTEAWIWVKVPQVDASSSIDFIYMYYGNPGAADAQYPSQVWDANYKAVYHLHGTSGIEYDSTNNNNNGTVNGATRGQAGQIDNAFSFDGVDDSVNCGSGASLDSMSALTVEAWIKPNSQGGGSLARVISKHTALATQGWDIALNTTNRIRFTVDYDSTDLVHTSNDNFITLGSWQYLVFTWDGSATAANSHLYKNTIEASYATTQNGVTNRVDDSSASFLIGNTPALNRAFDGLIDEVRISNVVRSVNWMKAQYLSMMLTFITFGSEEANFIRTEAGAGVEITAIITVLISGDGGIGGDTLKALIETSGSGSDMRLLGRQGQVRIPSKGVNL